MKHKFKQSDYILHQSFYEQALKHVKEEVDRLEKIGKETLWFFSIKETYKHLLEEKGANLTPRDVDNIIYILVGQLKGFPKPKL